MKHFKLVQIPSQELIDITCDMCGKKTYNNLDFWNAGVSLTLDAGFGSVYDGINKQYNLCDDCWSKLEKQLTTLSETK